MTGYWLSNQTIYVFNDIWRRVMCEYIISELLVIRLTKLIRHFM